jgi:hypothetical protein
MFMVGMALAEFFGDGLVLFRRNIENCCPRFFIDSMVAELFFTAILPD